MKYIKMNFINALNESLNRNLRMKIESEFVSNNTKDFDFSEPEEVLLKLANSSRADIKSLINAIWNVESKTYESMGIKEGEK